MTIEDIDKLLVRLEEAEDAKRKEIEAKEEEIEVLEKEKKLLSDASIKFSGLKGKLQSLLT